jgi:thiosulfate/3-mercaptopyruvate sulfurtransferase
MAEEKLASRWLVSTEWLAARLNDPNVVILDSSYYLANHKRDADAEFLAGHIPGAQRFDVDAISDKSNPLPHMLPPVEQFAAQVGALGVGDGVTVVLYDGLGLYGAARVWWTFRTFGSDNVRVLDGGMPKWKAENRPLETGPARPLPPKTFTAKFNRNMVASIDDVQKVLLDKTAQVVDARSASRFRGEAPEPRPNVRGGHMPGSFNVP